MDYDKILLKILMTSKNKINSSKNRKIINNKYPNIKEYLQNKYQDSESLQESLYRIKYHIEKRPVCKVCGNKIKYAGKGIYNEFCSHKCLGIGTNNKRKQTNLERYGEITPLKNETIKEKIKQTNLERYGEITPLKNETIKEKIKQTNLERYGVTNGGGSEQAKEKFKNTCLKRYGVDNPFKSSKIREKRKNTMITKYGYVYNFENKNVVENAKKTLLERYGTENFFSTRLFLQKRKITCLRKYGVDSYTKSIEFKNYITKNKDKIQEKTISNNLNKYGVKYPIQLPEVVKKMLKSKRKNHTFNTSKPEEELYLYIKEKFPLVERQYNKDKRYPWCCDFYIPELDCFIEYNGFQSHGPHPYDINSKEDRMLVEKWKQRYNNGEHPLYKKMIDGWTISDIKKRETAKENNLNFKEIWSIKDGKKFIDSL